MRFKTGFKPNEAEYCVNAIKEWLIRGKVELDPIVIR